MKARAGFVFLFAWDSNSNRFAMGAVRYSRGKDGAAQEPVAAVDVVRHSSAPGWITYAVLSGLPHLKVCANCAEKSKAHARVCPYLWADVRRRPATAGSSARVLAITVGTSMRRCGAAGYP